MKYKVIVRPEAEDDLAINDTVGKPLQESECLSNRSARDDLLQGLNNARRDCTRSRVFQAHGKN